MNCRGARVLVAAGAGLDADVDPDAPLGDDEGACPVCDDPDCSRLIHVHLGGPPDP